jgi:glycosyltransferase involved in cell wall biosynthesis
MKIQNRTGHSVYISDIDRNFSPTEIVNFYELSKQDLLKSTSLRKLIRSGAFYPVEWDVNSTLESSLQKESEQFYQAMVKEKNKESNGILLRGQFLDYSGYGKVNRNLAICLKKRGVNISVNAIDHAHPRLIGNDLIIGSSFSYTHSTVSDVVIDSIVPSFDTARGKKKSILYTTVESYTIPQNFSDIFKKYDEVWTTSNFCKSVISQHFSGPISVVPGIVDSQTYCIDGNRADIRNQSKSFKFISVFNWNYRKGPDALLKAYCKAFSNSDDVSLILVCRKKRISGPASGVKDEVEKTINDLNLKNPPHIMRVTKELNEDGIASLYRACNAFVLPSRGEGYGLPYLEASLCGLPVIGTNVSAVADILNTKNSLLLDIDRLSKVPQNATGAYFWDDHIMADLTSESFINSLADGMKDMYIHYKKYVEKNKDLQKFAIQHASADKVFSIIKERIN